MSVLLIHELGHFFAMKHFKCKNVRTIFLLVLGITTTSSIVKSRLNRTVISMAGPVPGIVLGSILLILSGYLPDEIYSLAEFLVIINFFNLIPIAVLDGGNIFETLFIPNSNKKIGIYNLVTGAGSLIYCFLHPDYFIIWLCILIILRGVLFFRHREEPPIISLSGILKPKQKILLTTIWCSTIIIALISIF
jgi:Zn-dependent protease